MAEERKWCPRCKIRLRNSKASYCRQCSAEYAKEQKLGKHSEHRACEQCGAFFRGRAKLCDACREGARLRTCPKCLVEWTGSGKSNLCRDCRLDYHKEWNNKHRVRLRDARFGLRVGQFDQMFQDQDGCCASCGDAFEDTPRIDHDHRCCDFTPRPGRPVCGKCVRGLLCQPCNSMLGHSQDSPERLEAGAAYLRRFQPPSTEV